MRRESRYHVEESELVGLKCPVERRGQLRHGVNLFAVATETLSNPDKVDVRQRAAEAIIVKHIYFQRKIAAPGTVVEDHGDNLDPATSRGLQFLNRQPRGTIADYRDHRLVPMGDLRADGRKESKTPKPHSNAIHSKPPKTLL